MLCVKIDQRRGQHDDQDLDSQGYVGNTYADINIGTYQITAHLLARDCCQGQLATDMLLLSQKRTLSYQHRYQNPLQL